MFNVFEDAKDVHVRVYGVYGKVSDGKIYEDPTFKTQVEEEDLQNYFNKGMVISVTDNNVTTVYTPVSISGNTVVTIGTEEVSTVLTAVPTVWTAKAKS